MRIHKNTELEIKPQETSGPSPDEDVVLVDTQRVLTDDVRKKLKETFGSRAKKVTLMGGTFVFLSLNREAWKSRVDGPLEELLKKKDGVTTEEREKILLKASVVFPFFHNPAEEITFWNNQPAGIQSRLAELIEHHSGYLVPALATDEDFYVESLDEDIDIDSLKPDEQYLEKVKQEVALPLRLVRFHRNWWVVRALTWTEAKSLQRKLMENPEGDHEENTLKECIVYGPKEFDSLAAGALMFLMSNVRQASGLVAEDEALFNSDVEEL